MYLDWRAGHDKLLMMVDPYTGRFCYALFVNARVVVIAEPTPC